MTDTVAPEDRTVEVVVAPAKVTTSLAITGVRHDGLHLIDAEMVTVDLCDRLEIQTPEPNRSVAVEVVDPDGVAPGCVPGDDNLVVRALRVAGRSAHVVLHKAIPDAAGLGGGSADAAAVLRWAGATDPATAVTLGADVAFCVTGGRARVTGIGEHLESLVHEPRQLTLCTPPVASPTPAVYRRWDDLGGPTGATNDLEAAALDLQPVLVQWRQLLGDVSGAVPVLAGSGSSFWLPGHHAAHLADAVATGRASWPEGRSPRLLRDVITVPAAWDGTSA